LAACNGTVVERLGLSQTDEGPFLGISESYAPQQLLEENLKIIRPAIRLSGLALTNETLLPLPDARCCANMKTIANCRAVRTMKTPKNGNQVKFPLRAFAFNITQPANTAINVRGSDSLDAVHNLFCNSPTYSFEERRVARRNVSQCVDRQGAYSMAIVTIKSIFNIEAATRKLSFFVILNLPGRKIWGLTADGGGHNPSLESGP
jgi:hypothetical protein